MAHTTPATFSATRPTTGEVAVPDYARGRRAHAETAPALQRIRQASVTLQGWQLGVTGSAVVTLAISTVIAWAVQR